MGALISLLSWQFVSRGKEPGLRFGISLCKERLTMKTGHIIKSYRNSLKNWFQGPSPLFYFCFCPVTTWALTLNYEDSGSCLSSQALLTDFILVEFTQIV